MHARYVVSNFSTDPRQLYYPEIYIRESWWFEHDFLVEIRRTRSNVFRDRSWKIWERWEKREEKRGEKARHRLKIPFAFSLPFPLSPGSALSAVCNICRVVKKKKKRRRDKLPSPWRRREGERRLSPGRKGFPHPLAERDSPLGGQTRKERQREKERERTPAPLRGLAAAVAAVSYLGLRGAPLYRRTATLGSLPLHPLLVFRATPIYPPFYHSCCTLCVQQPRPR